MHYQSRDLYIDGNSKELFLKKSEINIYKIFIELSDEVLVNEKFKHCKIVFHLNDEDENAQVDFTKFMEYNRKDEGRTIFSYMKDMINYLIKWNVNGFGHCCVVVEK